MSASAVDRLLREVSADQPCGLAIESNNDSYARFLELEKAAKPGPSRWDGTKDIPGKPPEWTDVGKRALELFEGADGAPPCKDLRVAVYLTRARLHTAGLPGFVEGLRLVRELLQTYWDSVYPQPQAEDGKEDASARGNALAPLGGEVVNEVRRAALITVPVLGPISWRDIEIAKGGAKPSGPADSHVLTAAQIEGVFAECLKKERESTKQQLFASYRAACDAHDHALAIKAILDAHAGQGESGRLAPLAALLSSIVALLTEKILALGLAAEAGIAEAAMPQDMPQPARGAAAPSLPGEITSRADVRATLQKLCDYYDRCEPSSPLPILLKRALRLVDKSFLEIIKDLAPGGLAQIEQLRGGDSEAERK